MSDPLGVLVVGADEREILALRDVAVPIIGGDAVVLTLKVSTNSVDSHLVWNTRPLEVRELAHDSDELLEPVEQFFSNEADIWKVIVDTAHRNDVALVVIACHRRKHLGRVVTKSAATDLLAHSDVAVLAVPDPVLTNHASPAPE